MKDELQSSPPRSKRSGRPALQVWEVPSYREDRFSGPVEGRFFGAAESYTSIRMADDETVRYQVFSPSFRHRSADIVD